MATTFEEREHVTQDDRAFDAPLRAVSRSIVNNWELIAYVVIFALAVFTRFYFLGERTMSHDESLHTVYSNNLYADGDYSHNPMMHGPILFHMTAFFYALFGVTDFTARIYTAVFGVLVVMFPLLLRRWLGRTGAVLAAVMLLASPLLMYYSRYIRHDMGSILAALVMFWAAVSYISGPPNLRRRNIWLYVLAGAMLWNLGSKETGFIYIAIFGLFLTIYWLARVVQHYFRVNGKMLFYSLNIGVLLAGVAGLAMIVVMSVTLQAQPTLDQRVTFLLDQFGNLAQFESISVAFSTFLSWTGLTIVFILSVVIGTALWAYRKDRDSLHVLDVVVGVLAVLIAMVISQMLSHTTEAGQVVSTSAASLALGVIAALSILLIYASMRMVLGRSFGRHFFVVIGITLVALVALIVFEELSHVPSRSGSEPVEQQPVPGQGAGAADGAIDSSFSEFPLLMVWGIAAVTIAGIVYTKVLGWWRELRHFPEFDVLMVMGSLVLPWLTAVFIVATNSSTIDWNAIAGAVPFLRSVLPVDGDVQVGQFVLGFLAWLPMMAISVVAGLAWDWKRWLIAAGVFYALFVFFFSTVFTSIEGLASGMIYSLQYWLEQQGERRGGQPQYYYTTIIMPIYEFLPVIGGFLAMLSGMVIFWKRRRAYDDETRPLLDEGADADSLEAGASGNVREEPGTVSADAGTSSSGDGDGKVGAMWEPPLPGYPRWWGFWLALVTVGALGFALLNFFLAPLRQTLFGINEAVLAIAGGVVFLGALVVLVGWFLGGGLRTAAQPLPDEADTGDAEEAAGTGRWRLDHVPVLLFIAWWAVMNLVGYTLAGEKMPWLGTHLTLPLILLAGWYFGRVIGRIQWRKLAQKGWVLLFLLPLAVVGLAQMIIPIVSGQPPFSGISKLELSWTYNWLAAAALFIITAGIAAWIAFRVTGWPLLRRTLALVVFVLLVTLTFRSAWMANFINYDLATEFLVYAHGAPANKEVPQMLTDLSERTTGGMDMKIMHDDRFNWPGSWYVREFWDQGNVIGIGSNPPRPQQVDEVDAVIVGSSNLSNVEPFVEGDFVRFQYKRMWWPMQDYFNVSASDVNRLFDFSSEQAAMTRRGIFDIWWARDYDAYQQAVNAGNDAPGASQRDFSLTQWPVSDDMYVFIRKDIASKVWQYGIGDAQVVESSDDTAEQSAGATTTASCIGNFQLLSANQVMTNEEMVNPLGVAVANDGRVLVGTDDENNSYINVFSEDGSWLQTFGQPGARSQQGAFFQRPNSAAVASDGTIYVVDTWNYMVRAFTSDYEFIASWGQPDTRGYDVSTQPVDGFYGPRDVAVGPNGSVYVVDTGNKRVRVYDESGNYQYDIGSGGTGDGQLNEPVGIAIHPDGRLFVADTWNQRIAVFNATTGNFITNYDLEAWDQGGRPYIALDSSRNLLYVADPDAGRVLVLDTDGNCVGAFGQRVQESPDASQYGALGGLATDAEGNVYISDPVFNRVLKFPPFPYEPNEQADDEIEDAGDSESDSESDSEDGIGEAGVLDPEEPLAELTEEAAPGDGSDP